MFKIAYCAGHYLGTAGKRCAKALDPNETREWVLNDRVADYFAKAAAEYEDVALYRTDDQTGKTFVDIPDRVAQANKWGANLYIDMHHNAAGQVFSGGGVEAFCYPGSAEGRKYRDAIYSAVVAAGGLKGNRAQPLQEKRFDSLSMTKMPAVLMEYGYMDSKVDVPIILTELYAKKVAYGTMEGIAKAAGLKKKPPVAEESSKTLYRVQVGAFKEKANAEALAARLKAAGFEAIIV
jgi:N-acetylmuramoyl-L-alanine amidase